jgi:hypothetical protein
LRSILKGQATPRFARRWFGIDSSVAAGRGSVIFGIWVDARKSRTPAVLKGGDAPKLLTADLKGATRLTLAVNDANDGTGSDTADWAAPSLRWPPARRRSRRFVAAAPETAPAIARQPIERADAELSAHHGRLARPPVHVSDSRGPVTNR